MIDGWRRCNLRVGESIREYPHFTSDIGKEKENLAPRCRRYCEEIDIIPNANH